jgi:hypothetical protein
MTNQYKCPQRVTIGFEATSRQILHINLDEFEAELVEVENEVEAEEGIEVGIVVVGVVVVVASTDVSAVVEGKDEFDIYTHKNSFLPPIKK